MINKYYQDDQRLDILVLGPMQEKSEQPSSGTTIRQALEEILASPPAQALLAASHTTAFKVHIPDGWDDHEIINGVLSHIDIADLVIINLTPKEGPEGVASPNVYYELGLVHSLGLPVIIIAQKGTKLPFYASQLRHTRVADFTVAEIKDKLTDPILRFLDLQDDTDFTNNRVTQFYDGLPLVDISASVGLATGYYYNFVSRLLREGNFISLYPEKIKQLIIVRPTNVLETYEQDKQRLTETLARHGYKLKTEKLDAPVSDGKGPCWIEHYDGIVIDLPRTIYPLKISPRLLAMQERLDKSPAAATTQQRDRLLRQASERLLDRIERAIRYHVRKEREGYRASLLHFSTIEQLPGLLLQFGAIPDNNQQGQ
jgi:nucleoside 2-deoxyribosyltransferase